MGNLMTGGCQCGRVRYRADASAAEAYLCHCRMCQRATGGFAASFVHVSAEAVAWEREPDWYASSPIARRPFCASCGTSLGFAYNDSDDMDLTVAAFDDPSRFVPRHHFGAENIHEAWLDTSGLKRIRSDEHRKLVERWEKAVGKMPE